MKTLIKATLLAAGLLAALLPTTNAATSDAATTASPAAHPRLRAMMARRAAIRHHLAKKLELSDAQKAQFKSQRAETIAAVKAIRADTSLTPEQKKAKVRETLVAAQAKMRSVLTPDQQAKVDAFRARLHRRHHRG